MRHSTAELVIRPLEPGDRELMLRFFYRLSPESLYFRFLSPVRRPEQAQPGRLLDIDHRTREALAALDRGELVAVARYAVSAPGEADIAVVVADDWQHHGVASCLLRQLAGLAAERGIRLLVGDALAENRRIIRLLREVFPDLRTGYRDGLVRFQIPVATPAA